MMHTLGNKHFSVDILYVCMCVCSEIFKSRCLSLCQGLIVGKKSITLFLFLSDQNHVLPPGKFNGCRQIAFKLGMSI